jgi:hypothetical protein
MKSQKIPKFNCEKCQYITNNKKDYNKHLLTLKHNIETMETFKETEKIPILHMCVCGMKYVTRNGLWKHKKKCNISEDNTNEYNECNNVSEKELLCKLAVSTF